MHLLDHFNDGKIDRPDSFTRIPIRLCWFSFLKVPFFVISGVSWFVSGFYTCPRTEQFSSEDGVPDYHFRYLSHVLLEIWNWLRMKPLAWNTMIYFSKKTWNYFRNSIEYHFVWRFLKLLFCTKRFSTFLDFGISGFGSEALRDSVWRDWRG